MMLHIDNLLQLIRNSSPCFSPNLPMWIGLRGDIKNQETDTEVELKFSKALEQCTFDLYYQVEGRKCFI